MNINMEESEIRSYLESLLFVSGEPMSFDKLSKVLGAPEAAIGEAADALAREYQERRGGLRIVINDRRLQMVTAGENAGTVEKLLKLDIEGELSRSALETISIIAYRGPLSRAQIDEIRGVNTSFTLRQLAIRGLVEKLDNPNDARAYLYKLSFDFLRHLGVERVEDLPRYRELREKELVSELLAKNEAAAAAETETGASAEVSAEDAADNQLNG